MSAVTALDNTRSIALANVDAELALLGAVLYDNAALEHAGELVCGDHFSEPFFGWLWDKITAMVQRGQLAEVLSVHEVAQTYGTAYEDDLGGLSFLVDLTEKAGPPQNAGDWARIIHDCAMRRRLVSAAQEGIQAAAMERDRPAIEVVTDLRRALEGVEQMDAGGGAWTDAGEAISEAIQRAQTRRGTIDYPTGVPSLDRFTGGLNAGEVSILAARPGVGKSVAALTVARANAEAGLGTCVFSLEMTSSALALRLACDLAYDRGAPVYSGETTSPTFSSASKGELAPWQWDKLAETAEEVSRWPLRIDDRAGLTIQQIESAARRQHREWSRKGIKPGPIIIDHLGRVRPSTDRRGNKHAEVADVSGETQVMAKRLGVPVVALVQLNRGVEGRDDKRPMLSDLRQAGELEEDARQVIFLYRPEYYCREGKPDETFEERAQRIEKLQACRNQLFWLVEKNSHGPRGQVQSFCEIACSAIREW